MDINLNIKVFERKKLIQGENSNLKELEKEAYNLNEADTVILESGSVLIKVSKEKAEELYNENRNIYMFTVHFGGLCLEYMNKEAIDPKCNFFNEFNITGYDCTYPDNDKEPSYFVAR